MENASPEDAAIMVGDPWDDIADIYGDLEEVLWRFKHTSKDDALFALNTHFGIHWGLHLRELLLYLHTLQY